MRGEITILYPNRELSVPNRLICSQSAEQQKWGGGGGGGGGDLYYVTSLLEICFSFSNVDWTMVSLAMQVEKGAGGEQLVLKTPIDDSYEEEGTGEMVIVLDKVREGGREGEGGRGGGKGSYLDPHGSSALVF